VFELVLFLRENGGELRSGPRSPRRAPGRVLREELPPPSAPFTGHTETPHGTVRLLRRLPPGRAQWPPPVRPRSRPPAAPPPRAGGPGSAPVSRAPPPPPWSSWSPERAERARPSWSTR